MQKLEKLSAAIGVEAIEVSEGGAFLNTEQLTALEETLSKEPEASDLSSKEEEISALNDKISSLETDLAAARKLPAAEPAAVHVSSDASDSGDINAILSPMTMSERIAYLKNHS